MKATPKKTNSTKKKVSKKKPKNNKKVVKKEAGAPSKYDSSFCELLIEHMKMGYSFESFPAVLYEKKKVLVSRKTLYNWMESYEDWAMAFEIASSFYLHYNETVMNEADTGERVNASLTIFRLANKFPTLYRRKDPESENGNNGGKIIIETKYNPKKD